MSEFEKCVMFSSIDSSCVSSQLQKRKEREEQLEDVIQAYEKIHMEKSNLQRDLDKMVRAAALLELSAETRSAARLIAGGGARGGGSRASNQVGWDHRSCACSD